MQTRKRRSVAMVDGEDRRAVEVDFKNLFLAYFTKKTKKNLKSPNLRYFSFSLIV